MQIFLDTANIDQIRQAAKLGIISGVTTNPSLVSKEGLADYQSVVKEICAIIPGPVSAEARRWLLMQARLDDAVISKIVDNDIQFILTENNRPLAVALRRPVQGFVLVFRNELHSLWRVDHSYLTRRLQS